MTSTTQHSTGKPEEKTNEFPIHIDKKTYRVTATEMTGAEIRRVPDTPIGSQFDLWLEVPGEDDKLIGDDATVELREGMHFYSSPKQINPGGC